MKRRATGRTAALLVAMAMATSGALAAQQHPHAPAEGQGQPGAMMHRMPSMPMPGPAMMLMHAERLGLSEAQVRRLEALAAEQHRSMQRLMPQAMRATADLMEAASGDIDVDAARAAHDRLARVHSEMLVATLGAMKEARQVLTPEQRTRWDAMAARIGGMMHRMGPMMMAPLMGH